MCLGGMTSSIYYAWIGHNELFQYYYFLPILISILQFISGLTIDKDIDGDAKKILDMSFNTRFKYITNAFA